MRDHKTQRGFTLVELMVSVVIVSILAAIALPYYNSFTAQSRRTEGINALSQVAALQERWYTENGTYVANLTALGLANSGSNTTENGLYTFNLIAASTTCPIIDCFILEAKPATGSAHADDTYWYRIASDGLRQTYDKEADSWSNGWK